MIQNDELAQMIRDMHERQGLMREDVATLVSWQKSTEVNVERFWHTDWPALMESVADHEARIRTLERAVTALEQIPSLVRTIQAEAVRMQGDIRRIDQWRVRVIGMVAGAGAAGSAIGGGVIWMLNTTGLLG